MIIKIHKFKAEIKRIGINPYVFVPTAILKNILEEASKDKGHIPIKGTVNQKPYTQTLVKYKKSYQFLVGERTFYW